MSMYSARLGKLPLHLTDNIGDSFRDVSEYDKGIGAMVIGCGSISSNNCIASPNRFSYLLEGSCSLISSQHLVFPWWLIDDWWRDDIRSSFGVVWEEVTGLEFT